MDFFNKDKLARAEANLKTLNDTHGKTAAELGSLAVKYSELEKQNKELQAQLDKVNKSEAQDSRITFYVDKEMKVRLETKINKDIVDTLVAEGYLAEKDIANEMAIHLAFLVIAGELTEQTIASFEGEPVDAAELRGDAKPSENDE